MVRVDMLYRVVQLNFAPEIEVFYVLFEKSLYIFSVTSIKHHIQYFHFRCKIQLDHPVRARGPLLDVDVAAVVRAEAVARLLSKAFGAGHLNKRTALRAQNRATVR